jgi:hypothetical protein
MQIYYWELVSLHIKRAHTVNYDECSTIMDRPFPNSRHLRDALDGKDLTVDEQDSSSPAAFELTSSSCPFTKLKVLGI